MRTACVCRLAFAFAFAAVVTSAPNVFGDDLRAHGTLGVAHAVSAPQSREFGFGGSVSASLEAPIGRSLGFEGKVGAFALAEGNAPRDPRLEKHGTGTAVVATLGLRVRPFISVAGPWASVGLGGTQTGNRTRFALDAAIGWDFRVTPTGRLDLGPFLGLTDIVQTESLRPEDAYLVSLGLHVGLGVREKTRVPDGDRDRDGVVDPTDACPDVPGLVTTNPKTNGCPPPPDRDLDAVIDAEDACPDVPGLRTTEKTTNGCPPNDHDRDKDAILDEVDACPEVPGIPTHDPSTNGCPLADRDLDGIGDLDDACPDLPGVPTSDPKTTGCPPAGESVHVEDNRILFDEVILFDVDSARVKHASWGIVKKLATFIIATPSILEVKIEGHADATGSADHNVTLSRDRAEAVKRLLARFGVAEDRVTAEAFGRSRPKVQTARAEAKNRRVEFWITRTPTSTSPSGSKDAAAPGGGTW